ncbi:MAG: DNA-methyltransferase [Acidimicrobiales bacterium]
MVIAPYHHEGGATIHHGNALEVLRSIPDHAVDAVITDPPYSSGGWSVPERTKAAPERKYQSTGVIKPLTGFEGDNRDQRSHGYWQALWLGECLRVTVPGGSCLVFTDWRQLPTTTDGLQAGGWVWQGIIVWHKRTARPRAGGFAASCEYLVWGSRGPLRKDHDVYLPGLVTTGTARAKSHLAEKPLSLLAVLVQVAPVGTVVLDPFMGSGSTLVAAIRAGRLAIGIELDEPYCAVAVRRLAQGVLDLHASMTAVPEPLLLDIPQQGSAS